MLSSTLHKVGWVGSSVAVRLHGRKSTCFEWSRADIFVPYRAREAAMTPKCTTSYRTRSSTERSSIAIPYKQKRRMTNDKSLTEPNPHAVSRLKLAQTAVPISQRVQLLAVRISLLPESFHCYHRRAFTVLDNSEFFETSIVCVSRHIHSSCTSSTQIVLLVGILVTLHVSQSLTTS